MHHPDDTNLLVEELPTAQLALRISLVTETYPPEVNGVASTISKVVDGLCARDHVVQLVRPRQGQAAAAATAQGFNEVLTRGMAIPMYAHLRMGLPSQRALVKLWTVRRPDIVHIATEGPLGWSALQAALRLKLPVCSDFRTNFQAYSQHYGMGWLQKPIMAYLRRFHNRCHCTMVPTEDLRKQLADAGMRPLSVVARGVDTRQFSPEKRSLSLREQWGAGPDDVVVLHVGRLAPEKNLAVLMEAFKKISHETPQARLVVVGDGPSRAHMQTQCPHVHFAGFQTGEALAAHYASADMFLFPSLTETYGNVTPEAMASGLAVVAFDDAAAGRMITHHTNGLLASKTDPDAFVGLAALLAGDSDLRARLRGPARAEALTHSWDAVLREIEDVYRLTMQRATTSQLALHEHGPQPG